MSINFPNDPAVNDEYTFEGKTWFWTGSKWNLIVDLGLTRDGSNWNGDATAQATFREEIGALAKDASNAGNDAAKSALLTAIGIDTSGAEGDIFYRNSAGLLAKLAKGTAGQKLRQNAALTAPEWESGWETIFKGASASAASHSFVDLSAFRRLKITGKILPASDVNAFLRFSTDNGSSFDATAANYPHTGAYQSGGGSSSTFLDETFAGLLLWVGTPSNVYGTSFEIIIDDFNQALRANVRGSVWQVDSGGVRRFFQYMTSYLGTTARNAIQFITASGNSSLPSIHIEGHR